MFWGGVNNKNQTNKKMMLIVIDVGLPNVMHYCFVTYILPARVKVKLNLSKMHILKIGEVF